ILGGYDGIYAAGGSATIVNFGQIEAPGSFFNGGPAANDGVFLAASGNVYNAPGALIASYHIGVFSSDQGGPVTLTNLGTIGANGTHCNDAAGLSGPEAGVGVLLGVPSVIRNGASGTTTATIEGYYRGIGTGYTGSATIVNFGTILST